MPKETVWANTMDVGKPDRKDMDKTSDGYWIIPWAEKVWSTIDPRDIETLAVQVQFMLEVGWGKDTEYVNLGINSYKHDNGVGAVDVPGFHVQLSYSAINKLIAYLRKARDQAFGLPE